MEAMETTMFKLNQYEILVEIAARCREMYGPGTLFEALVQASSSDVLQEAMKSPPDGDDEGHDQT
jgi:hypothetical protein